MRIIKHDTDPGANLTPKYKLEGGLRFPTTFLQKYGVTEIEALVLTHPDEDHYKGLAELSETYSVRKVAATATLFDADLASQQFDPHYLPDNTQLTVARKGGLSTYNRFSAMARDGNAEYVLLQSGSLLHEEPSGLQILCHSPDSSTLKKLASELLLSGFSGIIADNEIQPCGQLPSTRTTLNDPPIAAYLKAVALFDFNREGPHMACCRSSGTMSVIAFHKPAVLTKLNRAALSRFAASRRRILSTIRQSSPVSERSSHSCGPDSK